VALFILPYMKCFLVRLLDIIQDLESRLLECRNSRWVLHVL